MMEEARREAVAALDGREADELTALVRSSWEQRFGLVGVG
jgi:hypothetical protein